MSDKATGRCLCGKVRFTSEAISGVTICHCEICRRWGSGPGVAAHLDSAPEITGGDFITWYESSDWAER
ncbi:MAG: GFA family protein, partial [Dongiaceae bacterium]